MMTFKITVAADEGAHLVAAVDRATDLAEGETRRVDTMIDIAKAYLNATPDDLSGEDRHLVVVHTSVETLAAHRAEQPAAEPEPSADVPAGTSPQAARAGIRGLGGVEPATARRLACDGTLLAAVLDRDGTVLAVSERQRVVNRRQRRALMIRDQSLCQFPGCSRTKLLKAHHIRHWAHGGGPSWRT